MKKLLIPPLFLFALFVASCSTSKQAAKDSPFDPEADRKELVGSTWTIDRIFGKDINAPAGRANPHLTFTAYGKVQGHTGCNPINGTYTLEKGLRIKFENMASGLAFCGDIPYESEFLEVLNSADNYTLVNGVLSINKGRMAPMAVLQAQEPDLVNDINANFDPETARQDLVGGTWTVGQLYGKDISAPDGRKKPFLTFTMDGKVQGHTGCNSVNGTYTLEKGLRMKFSSMATTRMACPDVPYEREFLDALNNTYNYTVNNGELSLNKARMAPMAVLKKGK